MQNRVAAREKQGVVNQLKAQVLLFGALVLLAYISFQHQTLKTNSKHFKDTAELGCSLRTTEFGGAEPSASTGNLFKGDKIRSFNGQLELQKDHSNIKGSFPRFENATCTSWAVVTTINGPTDSIKEVSRLDDWCMVIVGDTETPDGDYQEAFASNHNVIYLSVMQQKQIENEFVKMVPYKSFARKNIGFLYSIAQGAKVIFDFDDDNVLKAGAFNKPISPFAIQGNRQNMLLRYLPEDHYKSTNYNETAFNPYPLMHPSEAMIWPRGFPLEHVEKSCLSTSSTSPIFGSIPLSSIGVIQSVCDGDPDVDAVYRLTRPLPISFNDDTTTASKLLVPAKSYAPYNAQATIHFYQAFWGLMLPMTVPGRVTDIWRAYFAQRIFQDLGLGLVYAPPMVTHTRNVHSYLADMQAENNLYYKTSKLLEFLQSWEDSSTSLPVRLEKLWIALYEHDYIGLDDVAAMQEWLKALLDVGYKFPEILQQSFQLNALSQPVLKGQPILSHPEWNVGVSGVTYPKFLEASNTKSSLASFQKWASEAPPFSLQLGGFLSRPSTIIVKLVMITKDEWPLLVQWTLYHGELIGFENLYIVDGSDDSRCIAFLKFARDSLGANVVFSDANLNALEDEITQIGLSIQGSSDFTIKMDTDEFLTVYTGSPICNNSIEKEGDCSISPYGLPDYLTKFDEWRTVADGGRLIIGYSTNSAANSDLCEIGKGYSISNFSYYPVQPIYHQFKVVADSRTFMAYDLGGHRNLFEKPFQDMEPKRTRLSIAHMHNRCVEDEVRNSRKAVLSHGYISQNLSEEKALEDLKSEWTGPEPCNATQLKNGLNPASWHKILIYAQFLDCPETMKKKYYGVDALNLDANPEFAQFLDFTLAKFGVKDLGQTI